MRTDLFHLPHDKQIEIRHIADLIREATDPEMIILFGSHARGDWVEDRYREGPVLYEYISDYDILVVIKSPKAEGGSHRLYRRVKDQIREVLPPGSHVNVIAHNIDFINNKLTEGQYFFSDIKAEGILLYDSGRHRLADAKQLPAEERTRIAQDEHRRWLKSAEVFYKQFEFAVGLKEYSNAAFQLHQAVERLLTAVLLVHAGHKPKTHDLADLEKLATAHAPALVRIFPRATDQERDRFDLLNRAYVDARYKPDYKITAEDLDYLGSRARQLRTVVDEACKKKIEGLSS